MMAFCRRRWCDWLQWFPRCHVTCTTSCCWTWNEAASSASDAAQDFYAYTQATHRQQAHDVVFVHKIHKSSFTSKLACKATLTLACILSPQVRGGCSVRRRTSQLEMRWYQRISRILLRHHWSSASTLDRAQHSDPYNIIGKMQTLYSFSLVLRESRDVQMQLSGHCDG